MEIPSLDLRYVSRAYCYWCKALLKYCLLYPPRSPARLLQRNASASKYSIRALSVHAPRALHNHICVCKTHLDPPVAAQPSNTAQLEQLAQVRRARQRVTTRTGGGRCAWSLHSRARSAVSQRGAHAPCAAVRAHGTAVPTRSHYLSTRVARTRLPPVSARPVLLPPLYGAIHTSPLAIQGGSTLATARRTRPATRVSCALSRPLMRAAGSLPSHAPTLPLPSLCPPFALLGAPRSSARQGLSCPGRPVASAQRVAIVKAAGSMATDLVALPVL